jgi:hypothetical protein
MRKKQYGDRDYRNQVLTSAKENLLPHEPRSYQ